MTNIWPSNPAWSAGQPRNCNRVAALDPGPGDLFVVTTIEGKRAFIEPITDYEKALKRAVEFARVTQRKRRFTIKVLSMSANELLAHMGLTPADLALDGFPQDETEFRREASELCMRVLCDSGDAIARADAHELLTQLGSVSQ